MNSWSEETDNNWNEYFTKVTAPRAVHDLRSAKISPWLLYLSETGDQLLEKFSDEQVKMIQQIIDATFWMKVFAQNKEEVKEIKNTCKVANL